MNLSLKEQRESKKVARLIALRVGEETGDYSGYVRVIKRPARAIEKNKKEKKKQIENHKHIGIHLMSEDLINESIIKNEFDYIRFNYKRKTISDIARNLEKSNQYVLNIIRKNKTNSLKFFLYKKGKVELIGSFYQLSKILDKNINSVYAERKNYPDRFLEIKKPFECIETLKKSAYFNELKKSVSNACGSKDSEE